MEKQNLCNSFVVREITGLPWRAGADRRREPTLHSFRASHEPNTLAFPIESRVRRFEGRRT